jgi:hypothetical protein
LATGRIRNSQSYVAGVGLSLGENHYPTNSLTCRELLTGVTTCLFNHGPDNPLLQPVSTQFLQGKDNSDSNKILLTHRRQQQQEIGYARPKTTTVPLRHSTDQITHRKATQMVKHKLGFAVWINLGSQDTRVGFSLLIGFSVV